MGKKWYVIQTYSGYENKVKEALLQRIKQHRWRTSSARCSSRPRRSRSTRRRQVAPASEDELPRVHLRRDGHERGRLAPRQGHAEGHGVHRQPAPARGDAPADRRPAQEHRRGRREAEAARLVRGGRRDPRHRRGVRELLGNGGRGQARQAEAPGEGLDLRARDAVELDFSQVEKRV